MPQLGSGSLPSLNLGFERYAGSIPVCGVKMTDTYKRNAPIEKKAVEELRLIRCLLERLLRVLSESNFVDYQMEKFGKKFKLDTHKKK